MKTLLGFSMSLCYITASTFQEQNILFKKKLLKIDITCHPATSSEYWISEPSKVQCASLCFMTNREQCSAMIWNTLERTCWIIESSEPMTLTAGDVLTDLNVYVIPKEGCTNIGYYFDSLTNTCLKFFSTSGKTWHDARTHCQQNGGDLITITTAEKWNFVNSFLSCKGNMWIGLKAEQWVNGDPFINVFGLLTQFNLLDSEYRGDNEKDCTVVYLRGVYVFQDESCNIRVRSNYLCEITMP
ncbi:CD206 [Mytilus edulis]|uniref:MRC n=1 Tax=Mytilus edulis TaxID=6550 RepID=A0A8S3TUQ2_MYTED|nr:CD206 [Mytilus edulis]